MDEIPMNIKFDAVPNGFLSNHTRESLPFTLTTDNLLSRINSKNLQSIGIQVPKGTVPDGLLTNLAPDPNGDIDMNQAPDEEYSICEDDLRLHEQLQTLVSLRPSYSRIGY